MKSATYLTRRLIASQWQPLLFVFLLGCTIGLQLEGSLGELGPTDDGSRWLLQLSMGLWDLGEGVLLFLILSWGIPKVWELNDVHFEQHPFQESYLSTFLAEYLRMMSSVLMYGLLIFIPGLIAYCVFIFVPYIAIFSKAYRADRISALKYSLALARGHFLKIALVFYGASIFQMVVDYLPQIFTGLNFWPVRILFMGFSLLIGIWTYSFFFLLFAKSMSEDKNGINV